jgi:hypothetical protein
VAKSSFQNVKITTGLHQSGVIGIQVAPKEWLTSNVDPDFLDGTIKSTANLIAGKSFIDLEFTPHSYLYDAKKKSNKNGAYTELTISGFVNSTDPDAINTLITLSYHELVGMVKDTMGRTRFVGNQEEGMVLVFSEKNGKDSHLIAVEMSMELEDQPPYYLYIAPTALPSPLPGTNKTNDMIVVNLNESGDTVIPWTTDLVTRFGNFPSFFCYAYDSVNNNYYPLQLSITSIGNPPTQFTVMNGGAAGKVNIQ